MPAVSKAQQRFMGMVHAVQKGDMEAPSKEVEKAADSMTDKDAKDFASTSHKGLPNKVESYIKEIIRETLRESFMNEQLQCEACWKGYKQVGMKDKGGRQVPNCVPNESVVTEDIPTKKVSPAEKAQNTNNRIKVLRAQIGAQKDPVKRAKIQSTLRNAMKTLSKDRTSNNK
jgi:hypothetical protein